MMMARIGLVAGLMLMGGAGAAQATTYTSQTAFQGQLGSMLTDNYTAATYGYQPGSYTVLTDSAMSAAFGQTRYTTITYPNTDIVGVVGNGQAPGYCSGCNGDFKLDFTATSVGTGSGVYGFGFGYTTIDGRTSTGVVTYGDGSSDTVTLAAPPGSGNSYFGDTSGLAIASFTTTSENLVISALTIGSQGAGGGGSSSPVPEPASAAVLGSGVVALGLLRRMRRSAR